LSSKLKRMDPGSTRPMIHFGRNDSAGAGGDLGTDVPLLIGVAPAAVLFGAGFDHAANWGARTLTGLRHVHRGSAVRSTIFATG